MSRRIAVWAEGTTVRLACLLAGLAFLLAAAPTARAQEADDPELGVEEVGEDAGGAEGAKVDPKAEKRRKAEAAAAAKRKAQEEARKKALADRAARVKAKEDARKKALEARAAKVKAKKMARERAAEDARKKKAAKARGETVLDDEALAKIRKSEEELRREARIASAQVSLPSDLRLTYLWSLPLERAVSKGDVWVHRDVILLLGDRSILYCVRKSDGVPMWAIELGAQPLYPPAVSKRMVYVFVENTFVGIDRARGEVVWRINPGFAPSATPCVADPNLYIPAWDKRVYAVEVAADKRVFHGGLTSDALTMTEYRFRELWHKTTGGHVLGTPSLLDGFLYFGSEDGYVYAISQDGEARYTAQTQGPIRAQVVARGANVYVGSADFSAYAYDRLTGSKQWTFPTGSHVLNTTYPDVPAGVAMVTSHKNGIFGVADRATAERGNEVWHVADAEGIAGVSQDFAYLVLSDRRLAAVEKTKGTVQWVSLLDGITDVVPTMNDWTRSDEQFRLFCLTESGHLACLKEPREAVRRALKKRQ